MSEIQELVDAAQQKRMKACGEWSGVRDITGELSTHACEQAALWEKMLAAAIAELGVKAQNLETENARLRAQDVQRVQFLVSANARVEVLEGEVAAGLELNTAWSAGYKKLKTAIEYAASMLEGAPSLGIGGEQIVRELRAALKD